MKARPGEVLPREVAAGEIIANEVSTGQIVGVVAGRGVKPRERNPAGIGVGIADKLRPAYFGAAEVGARQRGIAKIPSGDVR